MTGPIMDDNHEYDLSVARLCEAGPVADRRLHEVIQATLRRHGAPSARISVALVDDARIAELNQAHRRHSGPTDVLSFDLRDAFRDEHDNQPAIDGEIVVSGETARREAAARGHSLEAELSLYVVHGTLHLLGYDDQTDEDAGRMHALEDEILSSVGLGTVYEGRRRCG